GRADCRRPRALLPCPHGRGAHESRNAPTAPWVQSLMSSAYLTRWVHSHPSPGRVSVFQTLGRSFRVYASPLFRSVPPPPASALLALFHDSEPPPDPVSPPFEPLFEPESLPESWPAELSASEPVESEELSESASFADSEEPPDSESEPEFDWLPSEPESEPCEDELDE